MKKNQEILNELQPIAPALSTIATSETLYDIPANYFQEFEQQILLEVCPAKVFPNLSAATKEELFEVPAAYFENFSATLLDSIQQKELAKELIENAPILATIQKQPLYTVASNYFEQFEQNMLAAIQPPQAAKEKNKFAIWIEKIDASIATFFQPSIQFAFASVVGVALVALIFFQQQSTISNQFASLSEKEIANYVAMNADEFDESLAEVKPSKINYNALYDHSDEMKKEIEQLLINETSTTEILDELI